MHALASLPLVERLASEPRHESLGMDWLGEAEHLVPLVLPHHGVAARAKRQVLAELMNDGRVRPRALVREQRNLMRPALVHAGRRQLVLPSHRARSPRSRSSGTRTT